MNTKEALSRLYAAKNAANCGDEMEAQDALMREFPEGSILHIFVKNREYYSAIRFLEARS